MTIKWTVIVTVISLLLGLLICFVTPSKKDDDQK